MYSLIVLINVLVVLYVFRGWFRLRASNIISIARNSFNNSYKDRIDMLVEDIKHLSYDKLDDTVCVVGAVSDELTEHITFKPVPFNASPLYLRQCVFNARVPNELSGDEKLQFMVQQINDFNLINRVDDVNFKQFILK